MNGDGIRFIIAAIALTAGMICALAILLEYRSIVRRGAGLGVTA